MSVNPILRRARARKHYHAARARRRCVKCGCKATGGYGRCKGCRELQAANQKRYRIRQQKAALERSRGLAGQTKETR